MAQAVQPTSGPGLSQDEVFGILKNERRRNVIRYLTGNGGESTVRQLTAELAAIENDVPVEELTYAQRKAVYTSLYQTHLPKLDEAGVVDYDSRSGDVVLTDRVEDCDVHLEVAEGDVDPASTDERSRRWAALLVGFAHLNLAVVGGWVVALGGLGAGWLGLSGLGLAAALTVAAWFYWYDVVARR